jgi:prohibitin 1
MAAVRWLSRLAVGGVVAGAAGYSCAFVVRPGEGVVLYNRFFGVRDLPYEEGLHFRWPGIDDIKYFNVRLQPRVLVTTTGTKDLQMVNIRLRVLFRPEVSHLPELYRTYAQDYDERVLPSVSNEILKAVVAEYQAEELIVKREAVSERIFTLMSKKLKDEFKIILEDISLVDIQFGKEFMMAVEQKQVAQQEAERFKFVVMESEQRKKAAIIKAEGEAISARMISNALRTSGDGLLQLRAIEASRDIAAELAAAPQVNFVPGSMMMTMPSPRPQQPQFVMPPPVHAAAAQH